MIRRSRSASTALGASGAGNPSPGVPADQRSEESQSNAQRLGANNEYAEIALAELEDDEVGLWRCSAGTAATHYWTLDGDRVAWHRDMNPHTDPRYGVVYRDRKALCSKYSWAIPNDAAITALVQVGPIVEVGCGTGYWAKLIEDAGGSIRPFDIAAPRVGGGGLMRRGHHEGQPVWTPSVRRGGARAPGRFPDSTLFLCWPEYAKPVAFEALITHEVAGGKLVVYVGEWEGCTADDAFHHALEDRWREVASVEIPQWWGVHDRLTIHAHKKRRPKR